MQVKIIIDINPFFSSSASANRWLTLIEGLNSLNVKIDLLVVGNYQSSAEKNKLKSVSEINGIKIKYLTSLILSGIWQRRFYNYFGKYVQAFFIKKKLKNELSDFKGFVWAENNLIIWKIICSILNASKKSFKLISEMSEFLDILQYNKGNVLQRRAEKEKKIFFESIYIHKIDGLVLMTKTLMKHYSNFDSFPSLTHIPMTVDFQRFDKKPDVLPEFEMPYIAYIGVMDNAKDGVNILIDAFSQISKEYYELKLYLVGGWNYDTPSHLSRIKELDLENRIKWLGEYPRDVIPSIICNAKILTLPRPDSKQAQGGFPTKLGEYLATGVPVCATSVGEISDYLIDNKSIFFAEPGSVDSFANSLRNALKDSVKANKVGKQGKKIAEKHFNKKIQSRTLYKFLKQLLNENKK